MSIYTLSEEKPNRTDTKTKPAAKTRQYKISHAIMKILSLTVYSALFTPHKTQRAIYKTSYTTPLSTPQKRQTMKI